jgi:hypothetical protein
LVELELEWPPDFSAGFTAAEVKIAKFAAEAVSRRRRTAAGSAARVRPVFDRMVHDAQSVREPWLDTGSSAR